MVVQSGGLHQGNFCGSVTGRLPKPNWATFLQLMGHLTAPTSPKFVLDQEHDIEQELQNQVALVGST